MEKRTLNPWNWQDDFGFAQAVEVTGAGRTVYCAGQAAIGADGHPMHVSDLRAQINLAFDNLEAVLKQADLSISDVVRLNMYTTDVDAFLGQYEAVMLRLGDVRPSMTLAGVARLALPELMVEFEATAVE